MAGDGVGAAEAEAEAEADGFGLAEEDPEQPARTRTSAKPRWQTARAGLRPISQPPAELVRGDQPRPLRPDELDGPLHGNAALRPHRVDHHRRPRRTPATRRR